MKKRILKFFIVSVIATNVLYPQEIQGQQISDSSSQCNSYLLWIDGGFRPIEGNTYSGEFDPIYNVRMGIGKQYKTYQFYGFLELTHYKFYQADALFGPFETSDKRRDIALYGVGRFYRFVSLGFGLHYTREDNIILYDRPYRIISQSGVHNYLGFYYLVGLGYPLRISKSISLPVGLYFRSTRNNRVHRTDYERTYIALQIGVLYEVGK